MNNRFLFVVFVAMVSIQSRAETPTLSAGSLEGLWATSERGIVCQMQCGPNNVCAGKVVEASYPKEVGQALFKDLVFDVSTKTYQGYFARPDEPTDWVRVTVAVEGSTLSAVVKKFIFSKTLRFTKKPSGP
jgi:hypothetical protein